MNVTYLTQFFHFSILINSQSTAGLSYSFAGLKSIRIIYPHFIIPYNLKSYCDM
ncbi:MAG: hypothetical protein ACLRRG_08465 [Barnesiella sp.]